MSQSASQTFRITGLDCAEEVALLKREVGPVVGGEERLTFDILNGRMIVRGDGDGVPERAVVDAVRRAGLAPNRSTASLPIVEPPATFWQRRGRFVLTAVSGLALAAGHDCPMARGARRGREHAVRRRHPCRLLARASQGLGRRPPPASPI